MNQPQGTGRRAAAPALRAQCDAPFDRARRFAAGSCVAIGSLVAVALVTGCGPGREAQPPQEPPAAAPRTQRDGGAAAIATISENAFREAALQGELKTVQQAIEQGVNVDAADEDGRTALQLAAYDGHTDVVRKLLDCDPAVDHLDGAGRTALMYAASGANHETVQLLLEAGAHPDIIDKEEGFTALMFAAAEGQTEVVRSLLKHDADVTLTDIDGDSALDFATQNRHRDVVELLSR